MILEISFAVGFAILLAVYLPNIERIERWLNRWENKRTK